MKTDCAKNYKFRRVMVKKNILGIKLSNSKSLGGLCTKKAFNCRQHHYLLCKDKESLN